jgi:hypothetical protein
MRGQLEEIHAKVNELDVLLRGVIERQEGLVRDEKEARRLLLRLLQQPSRGMSDDRGTSGWGVVQAWACVGLLTAVAYASASVGTKAFQDADISAISAISQNSPHFTPGRPMPL